MDDWRLQLEQSHLSNLTFTCNQETCSFAWLGENTIMHQLRLAPQTVCAVEVTFKDQVASGIYVSLVTRGRNEKGEFYDDKGVVVRQGGEGTSGCHPQYDLSVKQRYRVGDRFWATIGMDPCASPKERERAFALNSGCLTRIGGCKTVESILPKVFDTP